MKFLKFLGLLFPCLSLTACTFNDVPKPLILDNFNNPKLAIDNSSTNTYVNSSNELVLSSFSETNLGNFVAKLYFNSLDLLPTDTYILFFYADIPNVGNHLPVYLYDPGIGDRVNVYYLSNHYDFFATVFFSNGALNVWWQRVTYSKVYFPLDINFNYGTYYLDLIRLSNNVNPSDIYNNGFVKNGIYQFDFNKFFKSYGDLMTSYNLSLQTFNCFDSYSHSSNYSKSIRGSSSLFYTNENDSSVYINFPFTNDTGSINYLYYPLYADSYFFSFDIFNYDNLPFNKFNYGLSDYNLCNFTAQSGGIAFRRDYSFDTNGDYTISGDNNYSTLLPYNQFGTNGYYLYFVCSKPLVMNQLYYSYSSISYVTNYYVLNRYYDVFSNNNFITAMYELYISCFTYLGLYTSTINENNSYVVGYYTNSLPTGIVSLNEYYNINFSTGANISVRKNNNNELMFYDNGNYYRYVLIALFNRITRTTSSYFPTNSGALSSLSNLVTIPISNTGITYLLDSTISSTFSFANLTIFNAYATGYNFVNQYSIVGSADVVYVTDTGTFYEYMFAIFDTPILMLSQLYVTMPFGFNIVALLLALIGLAVALFIIRLIV